MKNTNTSNKTFKIKSITLKRKANKAGYECALYGRSFCEADLEKRYGQYKINFLKAHSKHIQNITPEMQAENRAKLAGEHRAYGFNKLPSQAKISKKHPGNEKTYIKSFWDHYKPQRSKKTPNKNVQNFQPNQNLATEEIGSCSSEEFLPTEQTLPSSPIELSLYKEAIFGCGETDELELDAEKMNTLSFSPCLLPMFTSPLRRSQDELLSMYFASPLRKSQDDGQSFTFSSGI